MRDAELRGKLLKGFYDLRRNGKGWVPTTDLNVSGGRFVEANVIAGICEQLAQAGLIQWKPLIGAQEGFVVGMAKITGIGVDVIEGQKKSPIALEHAGSTPQGIDGYNTLLTDAHKISPDAVKLVELAGRERAELLLLEGIKKQQTGSSFVVDSHGTKKLPRNFFDLIEIELKKIEISATVPDQSLAPIRVEERDGKIAKIDDQNSPLNASEQDFNEWREPILEHLQEFLSREFRIGTNHSRARDRLTALNELLTGSIVEIKRKQFRFGYEVSRLQGLISAYRSDAEDMPDLNAGSLEDLDRLWITLVMGLDKLERWTEFSRIANNDSMNFDTANTIEIVTGLDEMAIEMEKRPEYFDAELPQTFRFLSEAIKDPIGAARITIYGAVRSAENVIVYLSKIALGVFTKSVDKVQNGISTAIAATLLIAFSGAGLTISGALPSQWSWLKPLISILKTRLD